MRYELEARHVPKRPITGRAGRRLARKVWSMLRFITNAWIERSYHKIIMLSLDWLWYKECLNRCDSVGRVYALNILVHAIDS